MRLLLGFMCLFFCMQVSAHVTSDLNTPVGYWKTIDDVTHQPKSIIHITEGKDHTLTGQILKIWPKPGKDEHEVCDQCRGAKHNQPIVGMVILTGLKQDAANHWDDGDILDPNNGKTYSCSMTVEKEGASLAVRGYIVFSVLGRSQTWLRVMGPR